jgi:tRNA pseudouridine38-40 synthase
MGGTAGAAPGPGARGARNFRLRVSYRGAGLCGWQRQENGLSVQELLEGAVGRVCGHPVTVHGSGRTDAGVHAEGQVASFLTTADRSPVQLVRGSNRFLPRNVAVLEAEEAPLGFHARHSSTGKRYAYDFLVGVARDPMLDWRAWWVGDRLDWGAAGRLLPVLLGEQDFRAFQSTGSDSKGSVREIYGARLLRPRPGIVRLELSGSGFLRHMVRSLAGAMREAGLGKLSPQGLRLALDSGTRPKDVPTAPAEGLCLMDAYYEPKERLREMLGGIGGLAEGPAVLGD